MFLFFFFKQKTAYEMRISDWSSDVCSSDLLDLEKLFEPVQTLDRGGVGQPVIVVESLDCFEERHFLFGGHGVGQMMILPRCRWHIRPLVGAGMRRARMTQCVQTALNWIIDRKSVV